MANAYTARLLADREAQLRFGGRFPKVRDAGSRFAPTIKAIPKGLIMDNECTITCYIKPWFRFLMNHLSLLKAVYRIGLLDFAINHGVKVD